MSTNQTPDDRIEAVSNATADEQHLVTLTVPPGATIDEALGRVGDERGEVTAPSAERALEAVRETLEEYDEPPANGLVVYGGVLDAQTVAYTFDELSGEVPDLRLERATEFETDLLDETGRTGEADETGGTGETYGLLVVEHGSATLGTFDGDGEVEQLSTFESDTAEDNPTEGELGDREQVERDFFEYVAEQAGVAFLGEDPDEQRREDAAPGRQTADPVEGLFVGGSNVTATEFVEGEYLDHRLQERIEGEPFAVEDPSEAGLEQLASKARDHLETAAREAVEERLETLYAEHDGDGDAVLGPDRTEEALEYEGVETTLVTEDVEEGDRQRLEERTTEQGGEFVEVPDEAEGADRLQDAGGVGAIARFPIE